MNDILKMIRRKGIVPVINIRREEDAIPLAAALRDGGLPVIEVTLRSEASLDAIRLIREEFPDMNIAAGTVLSPDMAEEAVAAGADAVVTPGFQMKTVRFCIERSIPIIPGCVTASEIASAAELGLTVLKFFPAEQSGGLKAIELLSGPFPSVRFIPTGGITYGNLPSYLSSKKVLACGGSYMAQEKLIRAGDWKTITENCRQALDLSIGFQLAHVGINHENNEEASASAEALCRILRVPLAEHSKSVFAGTFVENMKFPFWGTKGHIGFRVNSLERALAYLEEESISINEESKQFDAAGNLTCVYLRDEIGGFAIHLV